MSRLQFTALDDVYIAKYQKPMETQSINAVYDAEDSEKMPLPRMRV